MANNAPSNVASVITRDELIDLREQIRKINVQAPVTPSGDLLRDIWNFVVTPRHLAVAAVTAAFTTYYILSSNMPELIIIK